MFYDMHVHSTFSVDGRSSMDEHCFEAIKKGLKAICFTDHVDFNKIEQNKGKIKDNRVQNFNIDEYFDEINRMKRKYAQLKILSGIEFSEPHLFTKEFSIYSEYPFDCILGSIHHCKNGIFPGAANLTEQQAISEYYELMEATLEMGKFQVLAHLDFPRRYFDNWDINSITRNRILKLLVDKGITLEINSSTIVSTSDEPMPTWNIIEEYRMAGGKQLVFGSDAHYIDRIGYGFEQVLARIPSNMLVGYYQNRRFIEM